MEIVHDSDEKPIDTNDFKDALLASLYGQVEFLKSKLEEKDLLIRTLIRDNESYTRGNPSIATVRIVILIDASMASM